MEGQNRETLGERLANRLRSRSARRPRMALDASFYARFGLDDPWASPDVAADAEATGDGMVFLSGAPFYAMMRRLAMSRRQRERRQARFFERRAGTTMRAETRRWAGEADAGAPTLRMARTPTDAFILPPPVGAAETPATTAAESVAGPFERSASPPMRRSPWHTTPFVPARVVRGSDLAAARAQQARPLARVGERLQAASVDAAEAVVRVAGQLPARVKRSIATVIEDGLPPTMSIVEVVRVLRRVGAPTNVIREVIELAPEASVAAVAARRMPVGAWPARPAGLRTVLSRSPAMALAASADADRAASGTLASSERSTEHTGSERPRRAANTTATARASARSSAPAASSLLSASPVSRATAGRPAALRVVQATAAEAGGAPAPSAPAGRQAPPAVRRARPVTRRAGQLFLPALPAGDDASAEPVVHGSAHAVSRAASPAPAARRIARADGAAWAFVRAAEPVADEPSSVPHPVSAPRPAARAAVVSPSRPVVGPAGRIVTARFATAAAAMVAKASAVTGRPARAPRVARATRLVADPAAAALTLPAAGAPPVKQAFARFQAPEVPASSPAATLVPHATPRLDRPVRRAAVLAPTAFSSVTPIGAAPEANVVDASPAPTAAARRLDRATVASPRPGPAKALSSAPTARALRALSRAESPARTAALRVDGPRVSTTEVVRASAPAAAPAASPGPDARSAPTSGPMAWAPASRFDVPARRAGRRATVAPAIDGATLPASTPVREPTGRFVSARAARPSERGVPRLVAVGAGRVDVVYVSPATLGAPASSTASPSGASGAGGAPPAVVPRARPVRALAWAGSRANVATATAYRGAMVDGGLPAAERLLIADAPRVPDATQPGDAPPARPGARPVASRPSRSPVGRDRPARDAVAPARPANQLSAAAFVPPSFGFEDEPAAIPSAPARAPADADGPAPSQRAGAARPPLDRRLHDLATGGSPASSETAPTWNARADGAPRVRSVHGLFESLAKATTAEQVVRVLFARADGLVAAPSEVSAPIQQVISEIRQEVSRAPASAASDDATLPTRPMRVDAPRAEPLRPQSGGSRPASTTRVARGATRPVASRTRTIGAGSEDRIMKLVKKLQGLIHLAEAEHRLAEAQRQVRMAEDSHEARGEGGQGTRGGGQAGSNQDGSKLDIEQLGREVLDVVSRELEHRRERRMEDHDESIWW